MAELAVKRLAQPSELRDRKVKVLYPLCIVQSQIADADQHYEVSTRMKRLYQLAADLETTLQEAERQHTLIAKLRAQADAIVTMFEASHPKPA